MQDLKQQAFALQDWSSQHRRALHRQPELSLEEASTSDYCQQVLQALGYQITACWGYGFIADLNVQSATKRIALRADMDALPITETNQHDFVSENPGVAHMCGHDTHMTIALTTARLLKENSASLNVNVRFIFQPCEELVPGGALGMIEQGCLKGVDEVYGLHNDPNTEVGQLRTRVGPLTATADRFELTITGRGGHAALPHNCLDPIVAAASLINDWQHIISRRIDPAHIAILTVGKFQAGSNFNIIPDEAYLAGTIRTYDKADRRLIETIMQHTLQPLTAQSYQCDFNYIKGYDCIINHAVGVERVVKAGGKILGTENIDSDTAPVGWAEDFAYYLQHCPGAFYILGSGNTQRGITASLHSPNFDVDEACLRLGAAVMAQLVFDAGEL